MVVKNCLICKKPINRSASTRSPKLRRAPHAVTCSKPCARIYRRVYEHACSKIKRDNQKIK